MEKKRGRARSMRAPALGFFMGPGGAFPPGLAQRQLTRGSPCRVGAGLEPRVAHHWLRGRSGVALAVNQ